MREIPPLTKPKVSWKRRRATSSLYSGDKGITFFFSARRTRRGASARTSARARARLRISSSRPRAQIITCSTRVHSCARARAQAARRASERTNDQAIAHVQRRRARYQLRNPTCPTRSQQPRQALVPRHRSSPKAYFFIDTTCDARGKRGRDCTYAAAKRRRRRRQQRLNRSSRATTTTTNYKRPERGNINTRVLLTRYASSTGPDTFRS